MKTFGVFKPKSTIYTPNCGSWVRYILADEQDNRIKLGIAFLEYELNPDTKQSIHRIFEVLDPCPECKFDECQNL